MGPRASLDILAKKKTKKPLAPSGVRTQDPPAFTLPALYLPTFTSIHIAIHLTLMLVDTNFAKKIFGLADTC